MATAMTGRTGSTLQQLQRRWACSTPPRSGSAPCSAPASLWSSPRPPAWPEPCWPLLSWSPALIAYCNAVASAQLAARYPASGGTYVYGRKRLGEWPGFIAGWGFVTGKTASCAAMALTFGHYVAPDYATPLAVAAVVVADRGQPAGHHPDRAADPDPAGRGAGHPGVRAAAAVGLRRPASWHRTAADGGAAAGAAAWGVLPAAGLMFFAFAGYARIATLGEEVKDPARTIPRAILAALAAAFVHLPRAGAAAAGHLPPAAAGRIDGAAAGRRPQLRG